MPVRFDMDPMKIVDAKIKTRGGAKAIANAIKSKADKYVPFDNGPLKNTAFVSGGPYNAELTYIEPYAHYQYVGKVMVGKMPKKYASPERKLTYGNGKQRGADWINRAVNDQKREIKTDVEAITGGRMKWES